MSPTVIQIRSASANGLTAPELVPEPRSDDPGEDAYRNGSRRPHREDLTERVLPYGRIPINFFGLTDTRIYCRCGDARKRHGVHLPVAVGCMARR